jgi:hypothetical protein
MPQLGLGASRIYPDQVMPVAILNVCGIVNYTSNFSVGADNFVAGAANPNLNLTITGNVDSIGGLNDVLQVTFQDVGIVTPTKSLENSTGISAATGGCSYNITFSYRFAAANATVFKILQVSIGDESIVVDSVDKAADTWFLFTGTIVAGQPGTLRFTFPVSSGLSPDIVYLKDVVINNVN